MSGHNKWSKIKNKKAVTDAQKNSAFTKALKLIHSTVKAGGPNPETNFKLKMAMDSAKQSGVPITTIENGIKKASGAGADATVMEDITYEGYGPGGVAVLIHVTTDNRNRSVSEIRHSFNKHNGSLGENGCVGWMFEQKGAIYVAAPKATQEELMLKVMELPVEDIEQDDAGMTIYTLAENLHTVKIGLETAKIIPENPELIMKPKNTVKVEDPAIAKQVVALLSDMEDHEDVQGVYANADFPDSVLANLEE